MNAINPIPLLTGSVTPTRKSKRSSLIADQESILKAAKLKALKNLEVSDKQYFIQMHFLQS